MGLYWPTLCQSGIFRGALIADGGIFFSGRAYLFEVAFLNKGILLALACFLMGNVLYWGHHFPVVKRWCGNSFAEIAVTVAFFSLILVFPGCPETLLLSVISAMILTFSFDAGIISKLLRTNVFEFLGKRSFSIYMVHWTIVALWPLVESNVILASPTLFEIYQTLWVDKVLYVLVICLVSHFTWTQIEVPAQKYILKKSRGGSSRAISRRHKYPKGR